MDEQPEILKDWYNNSSSNDGSCVDVRFLADGTTQVRHSKKPGAEVITYDAAEWDAFISGAKTGKFDRPDA